MSYLKVSDRIGGSLCLILTLLVLLTIRWEKRAPEVPEAGCENRLFVEISGTVRNPGVYDFCKKADLYDLIIRAGGVMHPHLLSESFRKTSVTSGNRFVLYKEKGGYGFVRGEMTAFQKVTLNIPISINHESQEGLTALPGIGHGLARAIVLERSKMGGFSRLDDLKSIRGIGPKLFEKMASYVTL
jgi:competence protein ComEA